MTQAFNSAITTISQAFQNYSASGSGSGMPLVATINTALGTLSSQVRSDLANVPNSSEVSTFIQQQLGNDEYVLDALADNLETTVNLGGSNTGALDAVLASDVAELTELNALYDIESLGGDSSNGS